MYRSIQTVFVGDGNYQNLMNSIAAGNRPFKYVDYLYIGFAQLQPGSNPPALYFDQDARVRAVVAEARAENPELVLFAQTGWVGGFSSLDTDEKIAAFAQTIPAFLDRYGLDGLDFDWEQVPFEEGTASYLFTQVKQAIGNARYLSISPDTTEALDAQVVNRYVDIVNVQSYQRLNYIDRFIGLGIEPGKIHVGICSENDSTSGFFPPECGIAAYIAKCVEVGAGGLYAWRIDNDDTDHQTNLPRYTITRQMWQFTRGTLAQEVGGAGFDDSLMKRDRQGNALPVTAPIATLTVRHGDVLDAIQAGDGDGQLPQHGGYSGTAEPIALNAGDSIVEVFGYTGAWFGRNCVVQLSLRTARGQLLGPYGSMANTTDRQPFSYQAPAGKAFVGFKGTLVDVPLAGAPATTVVAQLQPV
ncbi:glycosyl hydrolase family 18 protein [Chitinimonas koreensis]|uniref:glycosyl hydrolase family 18 protein n=1 Tax=Chitinimonas koreensis TaxID=356302 RepID=UPI00041BB553|nr:glycosyl hydrolase family 18 protein [Chitinimonas koreensis]